MKLGIVFGGKSPEHEVSIMSAKSVIDNLDNSKYEIYPIYLDKENNWYKVKLDNIRAIGDYPSNLEPINAIDYLKALDKVFPVMHGEYGEDGNIQGFLTMLGISYVGCKTLSSAVCMDKFYTKYLLKNAGILVAPDITIIVQDDAYYFNDNFDYKKTSEEGIGNRIESSFGYPVFVKPASLGSSVGVSKADNLNELIKSLNEAKKYDSKILIEKMVVGRELECGVLNGKATSIGEIHAHGIFYSFASKYTDEKSYTCIPKNLKIEQIKEIKRIAELAFRVVNGHDLARIDFFLESETNKIFLNEINTLPGFTKISMYPKLALEAGISYQELLDKLIQE